MTLQTNSPEPATSQANAALQATRRAAIKARTAQLIAQDGVGDTVSVIYKVEDIETVTDPNDNALYVQPVDEG